MGFSQRERFIVSYPYAESKPPRVGLGILARNAAHAGKIFQKEFFLQGICRCKLSIKEVR